MTAHAYAADGSIIEGWVGVDLDGTLAEYHGWIDGGAVGAPIPLMVARVAAWLAEGVEVRIVTARVSHPAQRAAQVEIINRWCAHVFGRILPITHEKDMAMIALWDDRAVSVEPNTGRDLREAALTFASLRAANASRVVRWHGDADEWSGADWSNAMCGEAGEAANVIKKIRRHETHTGTSYNTPPLEALMPALAEELADVVTYADLLARKYGIDLGAAVAAKFNKVSAAQDFPERLPEVAVGA